MDGASKLKNLNQNEKILFFDEFAVYDRPSMFYGWAEKNTRPKIPSNEKRKRHKVNGLLSVDAFTGEEYLQLKLKAKTLCYSKSVNMLEYSIGLLLFYLKFKTYLL